MKKIYSISELVALGYPRTFLYELVHRRAFPKIQRKTKNGKGKFYINIDDLNEWIEKGRA